MLILGINGGAKREDEDNRQSFAFHDSAAVLIKDGEILAAAEEERFNRIKHSNNFPVKAIKYCLKQNNLELNNIDYIAIDYEEPAADQWAKTLYLNDPSIRTRPIGRYFLASLFERDFGFDVKDKLYFCKHHIGHAWSAFSPSGFDSSLILVLDGQGDNRSGMVLLGEGSRITVLHEYSVRKSLGELYTFIIKLLGYDRFDEYKAMGLAPYGNPDTYARLFEDRYNLLPDGDYDLDSLNNWFACLEKAGLLSKARRKGEPFTQVHKDIAATLQSTIEKIVLHILRYYRDVTTQKRLCLAGGVAHNCSMNGKILYSGLFEDIFVQPAAHDAGNALGAALGALNEKCSDSQKRKLTHLYFGTDVGHDNEIIKVLSKWKTFLTYKRINNITKTAAKLIANGAVIGWVQGRSEFGPRALGNRSILADPRPARNKQLINQMVKQREGFRPFAPAVLEEKLNDYFDIPSGQTDFSFMLFVVNVRQEMRERLGAVTHVDGTARVQAVSKHSNPKFWDLIHEFGRLTGIDMVLNTSLNNNVEPIVDSVEDAINCFLTTGIQYLVVGNYLVSNKQLDPFDVAYKSLIPNLSPSRRLIQRKKLENGDHVKTIFELESTMNRLFSQETIQLSEDAFVLLQGADKNMPISYLMDSAGLDNQRENQVIQQLIELWSKRAISLTPVS